MKGQELQVILVRTDAEMGDPLQRRGDWLPVGNEDFGGVIMEFHLPSDGRLATATACPIRRLFSSDPCNLILPVNSGNYRPGKRISTYVLRH